MSRAEKWTGNGLSWIPTVSCMLLAIIPTKIAGFSIASLFVLYVIIGLPIFEIISVLKTKHTLSQNLIKWPTSSIRDFILYFLWLGLMVLAMIGTVYPVWNQTLISLLLATSLLLWGKQRWMACYVIYIMIGIVGFEHFFHVKHMLYELSNTLKFSFQGLMTLSMVFLGFHTWEIYEQ